MRFELHNNGTLHTICITGDVYSKAEPCIDLIFAKGIQKDIISSFIATHLPNCSGEARIESYGIGRVPDGYRARVGGKHFRYIVEQLFSNSIMKNYERANIENTVRELETVFIKRNKVTSGISTAQRDVLESVVSPYVDSLFIQSDPVTSLRLMTYALIFEYHDIAQCRNILVHGKIWSSVKDKVTEPGAQKDIFGSMCSISKFVAGHGTIESAYEQTGVGIPKLDVQKRVVIDLMHKEFKDHFNVDDPKIDFITYVALSEKLTGHLSGIDFTNPDTAIAQFFASVAPKVGSTSYDVDTNKSLIDDLDRYLLATNHSFEELGLENALSKEQMEMYTSNAEKKSANLRSLNLAVYRCEDKTANLEDRTSWVSTIDRVGTTRTIAGNREI